MLDKLSGLILIICVLIVISVVFTPVILWVYGLLLPIFVTIIHYVLGV
jgi:hypothetical protein